LNGRSRVRQSGLLPNEYYLEPVRRSIRGFAVGSSRICASVPVPEAEAASSGGPGGSGDVDGLRVRDIRGAVFYKLASGRYVLDFVPVLLLAGLFVCLWLRWICHPGDACPPP